MLKADIARLAALASTDEAVRVAAADALAALPEYHFDDHDVDAQRLPDDWVEAVATAWRDTSSDAVRAWIAQAVALANPWPRRAVEPLMRGFLDVDGPYFHIVVRFVMVAGSEQKELKERILSLRRHRDRRVRGELVSCLGRWIDDAEDGAVVREMMLDPDNAVREYAVMLAEKAGTLGVADFEALLDVVNMDNRNARIRAKRLIDKLSATVPGCSLDHAAPRVPLLRTDGLYYATVTEFDRAGRWMTLRCLRFFADGRVQAFGTDEAPFDLGDTMPHRSHDVSRGSVRQDGARVVFTVESAAGVEDCEGRIDGSEIRVTRVDRATGRETQAAYEFGFIAWDAPPPAPVARKTPRGKPAVALPFERLRPNSLIMSHAAVWYLRMVPRLAIYTAGIADPAQRFERTWFLKSELRESAARSLFDASLKRMFFETMPLPAAADLLRAAADDSPDACTQAVSALTTVTTAECRSFIGQLSEDIGTAYDGAEGHFVLTAQGWVRR